MSGASKYKKLAVTAVLFGFCVYIVSLFAQGTITLYIHPRYKWFSAIMAVYGIIFLLIGVVLELKKWRLQRTAQAESTEPLPFRALECLLVVVLVLAFALPPQAISSEAISNKSLNTPTYDEADAANVAQKPCPASSPEAFEEWIGEMGQYPMHCYIGKDITLTGFIYESADYKLPSDMYYLGRVVMSCCVIDARPYGLPIQQKDFPRYAKDTWLRVEGKLEVGRVQGGKGLVVNPSSVVQVQNPEQPYEYINTPAGQELQPYQPL